MTVEKFWVFEKSAISTCADPIDSSVWKFRTSDLDSIRVVFNARKLVTGVVIKCLSDLDSASERITFISSIDVAFIDQTGLERTHYDGKPVGTGLAACRCFDKAFYIALSVRVKTSQIIIYPKVTSSDLSRS